MYETEVLEWMLWKQLNIRIRDIFPEDTLYDEALDYMRVIEFASLIDLQKRFRIEYDRAEKIMNMMNKANLIEGIKTGSHQDSLEKTKTPDVWKQGTGTRFGQETMEDNTT